MAKVTLPDVTNILGNPTSAANRLNQNNTALEDAFENTLSRDGTGPNQMLADFDMNNNDILNVKQASVKELLIDGERATPTDLVNTSNFATAEQGQKADEIFDSLSTSLLLDGAADPQFDFAAGVLAQLLRFSVGVPVVIPDGKQLDFIRNENTIQLGNNSQTATLLFDNTVSGGNANSNAYGVIGALHNAGPGAVKGVYGRALADVGCTGVLVGLVGGVRTRDGVATSIGLQLSLDSYDGEPVTYGIWLHGSPGTGGVIPTPVDYGLLFSDTLSIQESAIRMLAAGGGKFLHLTDDTGAVDRFLVANDGSLFSAGAGTFLGSVSVGGLNVGNNNITFDPGGGVSFQALASPASGPDSASFRVIASGVGDVLKFFAGSSLPHIRIGGSLWELNVGAEDSGGSGSRQVVVANTPL